MKDKKKAWLAAVLAGCLSVASFAAGGTLQDPLITLSQLKTIYTDKLHTRTETQAQSLYNAAAGMLDQKAAALKSDMASGGVDTQAITSAVLQRVNGAVTTVTVKKGDKITGPLGAGFVMTQGSADIIGRELVNITAGGTRSAGRYIANNIYYLIPAADGSGIVVTSETAVIQLRDGAAVNGGTPVVSYEKYAKALNTMNLFRGTDIGYELERTPTRLETLVILIRMLGEEQQALAYTGKHPFTDVKTPWADANKYIAYAVAKGYTNGISATEFAPNAEANASTLYTFILRALGYSDRAGDFAWNSTDRTKIVEVGVLTQAQLDTIQRGNFLRGHAALICYQAMPVVTKDGSQTLLQKLIAAGAVTWQQYVQATVIVGQ